ncbi:hypothetical protein T492DRAFT_877243 [Pavlovales sp. CCMP2436]|nr:hypothetical protein T492DRAFT_877243 [Pavlovales sp. CCMP2436]
MDDPASGYSVYADAITALLPALLVRVIAGVAAFVGARMTGGVGGVGVGAVIVTAGRPASACMVLRGDAVAGVCGDWKGAERIDDKHRQERILGHAHFSRVRGKLVDLERLARSLRRSAPPGRCRVDERRRANIGARAQTGRRLSRHRRAASERLEARPRRATFRAVLGDCVFKLLEVSDSDVEGISDVPSNAFSLMEKPRVKRPAERAAATEDDASDTLSRILEVYSLPSVELQKGRVGQRKTVVPEEALTREQKMQRLRRTSRSDKRREGGLWDPNVDGGGILQSGTAIRCYTLGHIDQHKGADGKYLGVADLTWLVKKLNALKDTDGYPRCSISG